MADIERAKEFYARLGWRLDQTPPGVVQFTPHGSACSVQFGTGLTSAAPGSGKGYLSVPDIDAARTALLAAGVEVGAVFHPRPDASVEGLDPERRSYFSPTAFRDPDGNTWLLQEVPPGSPAVSNPARRPSLPGPIWRVRSDARQPPTVQMPCVAIRCFAIPGMYLDQMFS
ncbi:VOC family protein [Streptomyces sp. 900105245]